MSAATMQPDLDASLLEQLAPPCDGKNCDQPVRWVGVKLCCAMVYLWCQPHHDVLVMALANHHGYVCFKCGAVDPPVRWERL